MLVRPLEQDERTTGGIIIPDTAKEKPQQGEVVAAGPGSRDNTGKTMPLDVKKRQHVSCSANTRVPKSSSTARNWYLIMREDEVMGVLENGDGAAKKKK